MSQIEKLKKNLKDNLMKYTFSLNENMVKSKKNYSFKQSVESKLVSCQENTLMSLVLFN